MLEVTLVFAVISLFLAYLYVNEDKLHFRILFFFFGVLTLLVLIFTPIFSVKTGEMLLYDDLGVYTGKVITTSVYPSNLINLNVTVFNVVFIVVFLFFLLVTLLTLIVEGFKQWKLDKHPQDDTMEGF